VKVISAIAFDSSYIYFVSSGQNVVRRVSSSGIISRFAGTGSITYTTPSVASSTNLYSPIGLVSDLSGNFYISDMLVRIRKVSSTAIVTNFAGSGEYNQAIPDIPIHC